MTVTSQVTAQVTIDGTVLDVITCDVSQDETRVPFAEASFTVPLDDTTAGVDPAQYPPPRVRIVLTQRFNPSPTLAELSADFAGHDLAWLTVALAGQTVGSIFSLIEDDWNPDVRAVVTQSYDLGIRSRDLDHLAQTVTFTAATDEAALGDYALMAAGPVVSGPTLRDAARLAVGMASPGAILTYPASQGRATFDVEARYWNPGVTAWDWVSGILASKGYRLWCDVQRIWHLESADAVISYPAGTLSTVETVTNVRDHVDREASGWAEGVVVTYEWTNQSSVRQVAYDIAGTTGNRVISVHRSTPYPGSGEASARLVAAQRRERTLTVACVFDPSVRAAQPMTLETLAGDLTGYVSGVAWDVPADEMTVTMRDVVEV